MDRLCDQTRGQNAAVTCFYFDFAARKEQTATTMLGSLLKQVIIRMERVPEEISRPLQEQRKAVSGRKPQLHDIVKMLQLITSSQRTFMVIDALDECTAMQRYRLFDSLKEILEKSPGSRIFVTGRPHIRAEIENRLVGRATSVSVGPTNDDIVTFLRVRLSEDETPDAMDEILEADILEKISGSISEMWVAVTAENPIPHYRLIGMFRFLLVSLSIEAILQESTIYRRRERLRKMTDGLGLGDVYGATIERIKAQGGDKSRLGMEALMWISHAERPLSADELCHALAIELGSTEFNAGNIPSMTTLVSCCQGLIAADKEASTVRLIHFTLQEYISAHSDIFSRPHSAMAEICLTYLNSQQVKALSANPAPDIQDKPFLKYCSVYWGVHAKKQLSESTMSLALQLFKEYDDHISWKLLLDEAGFPDPDDVEFLDPDDIGEGPPFSGLHCAAFFGIVEIAAALMETGCYDPDGEDYLGRTPLVWAAEGHEEVVKILLGQEEVNPDEPDSYGQTPLSVAAEGGHEGVVKILLGRDEVNSDKLENGGWTPLSLAAVNGHEGVVKMLLEREEVNPDKPDNDGRTPLSHAAEYWREGVIRILSGRKDVNPYREDNYGQPPHMWIPISDHDEAVPQP